MGTKNQKKNNADSQIKKNAKQQVSEKTEKVSAKGKKSSKKQKPDTDEMEDSFDEVDDFGSDEIGEYEEELQAVEEDEESSDVDSVDISEEVTWTADATSSSDEEIYLTDADGNRYCRSRDCDQVAAVEAYCRYHYLLFWRRIQNRKKILEDGKLTNYVEELTARFPDKFLEMIRKDLRTEKDFLGAIQELEIDEAGLDNEMEEDAQSFIDEVRGMGEGSASMDDDEF